MEAASNPAEIKVRKATGEDYESIVVISNGVYGGHDYLLKAYQRWIANPDKHMYVAVTTVDNSSIGEAEDVRKSSEQVLGFYSLSIFDDGATAVNQALRVSTAARGMGIAKILTKHYLTTVANEFPDVIRLRATTHANNNPSVAIHQKQGYEVISELGFVGRLVLPADALATLGGPDAVVKNLIGDNDVVIREADVEEVISLILSDKRKGVDTLFPHGLLVYDWVPLSAHEEASVRWTFNHLSQMERKFYVSISSDGGIDSLSIGGTVARENGPTFLGTILSRNDGKHFQRHLAQQVGDVITSDDVSLIITYDAELAESSEVLEPFETHYKGIIDNFFKTFGSDKGIIVMQNEKKPWSNNPV